MPPKPVSKKKRRRKLFVPKKRKVDNTEWHKIRDIIGENDHSYEVDWADDSDTGEQFPPEWV